MENIYYYNGDKLNVIKETEIDGTNYAITDNGDDYVEIHRKSNLKKWEETYQYQEQQKIKEQTQKLKAEQEELIKQMRNKALEQLTFSIKLNSTFSKDNKINTIGIQLANQLQIILDKMNPDTKSN